MRIFMLTQIIGLAAIAIPLPALAADDLIFHMKANCFSGPSTLKDKFDSTARVRTSCKWGGAVCYNDEIRSLVVATSVKPGTLIRVYDDPNGKKTDDWTEIVIRTARINSNGAPSGGMCIPTFENNYSGTDYKTRYHRKNGLDGKVSYIQVDPAP